MISLFAQQLFAIPVFVGSLLCVGFILAGLGRLNHPTAKSFVGVMIFAFLYSFFYGLELLAHDIAQKKLFLVLQYSGALFISPQFWWFTRTYAVEQKKDFFPPWYLFVFPMFLFVFQAFDNNLQLFYTNFHLAQLPDGSQFLEYENGVLFYMHSAYSVFFVLASVYQLVTVYFNVPARLKQQVLSIAVGFGIGVFGYLVALSEVLPTFVDPVPISFVVCGTILFFSIARFDFLKQSPIAFETLFTHLTDAVFVFGNKGNVLLLNPSAERLLQETGVSEDEIKHLCKSSGLKAVDQFAALDSESGELFMNDQWFKIEHRAIRNNQSFDGDIYVIRNISQRKKNELAIKEANNKLMKSEQEFRLLVENNRDLIFKTNPLGKITYLSPVFPSLFAKPISAVLNTPFFDLIYSPDQLKIKDAFVHMVSNGERFTTLTYRVLKGDNTIMWHQVDFVAECNEKGGVTSVFGTARDITSSKNAEISLLQSERTAKKLAVQYETVINNQSVYFIKINTSGEIIYANPFFKASISEGMTFLNEPFAAVVDANCKNAISEAISFCLSHPNTPKELIVRSEDNGVLKGGSKWELRGIANRYNRVVEILAVGVDITAQLNNLETAENLLKVTKKQNERLRSFAYIISHNVRSHSANLSGLLNLANEATDNKEKLKLMPLLRSTADRLEETLQNLNEVLTVQDDLKKHKTQKNLYQVIQHTLDILSNEVHKTAAKVTVNVSKDMSVAVIAAYLDSVLLNLLSNALRYRHPERTPEITISAEENTSGAVVLNIADNGIGIDTKRYQNKLFGLYKTFHGNAEAKGVGLFLAKAQMEAMGGSIAVESTVNEGATFTMVFPAD